MASQRSQRRVVRVSSGGSTSAGTLLEFLDAQRGFCLREVFLGIEFFTRFACECLQVRALRRSHRLITGLPLLRAAKRCGIAIALRAIVILHRVLLLSFRYRKNARSGRAFLRNIYLSRVFTRGTSSRGLAHASTQQQTAEQPRSVRRSSFDRPFDDREDLFDDGSFRQGANITDGPQESRSRGGGFSEVS